MVKFSDCDELQRDTQLAKVERIGDSECSLYNEVCCTHTPCLPHFKTQESF